MSFSKLSPVEYYKDSLCIIFFANGKNDSQISSKKNLKLFFKNNSN